MLEIRRDNAAQDVKRVTTRFTLEQTREAEVAIKMLGDRSLLAAVDFYIANFREQ